MNELAVLTNDELAAAINAIEERKAFLATDAGKVRACTNFMDIFKYLEQFGYKFDGDPKLKSQIWTDALREEIAIYGFEGIRDAVKNFALNDTREYRPFPMPSDIIAECRKSGRNPKVELGRREQKRREAELEAQWRAECKVDKKPEEIEAWLQKMRERGRKCLQ